MGKQLTSERVDVENLHDAINLYFDRGWTGALPVAPPTEHRLMKFLGFGQMEPELIIGEIPLHALGNKSLESGSSRK